MKTKIVFGGILALLVVSCVLAYTQLSFLFVKYCEKVNFGLSGSRWEEVVVTKSYYVTSGILLISGLCAYLCKQRTVEFRMVAAGTVFVGCFCIVLIAFFVALLMVIMPPGMWGE